MSVNKTEWLHYVYFLSLKAKVARNWNCVMFSSMQIVIIPAAATEGSHTSQLYVNSNFWASNNIEAGQTQERVGGIGWDLWMTWTQHL